MAKYNFELKKKIVLEHLSLGVGSKALAKKYNVKSARQIQQWIHNYNEFGEEGLKRSRQKNNYSFEFKLHMVESYLSNEVSYEELALANGITNYTMISRWVEAFRVAGPDGLRPRKKGRKKTLDNSVCNKISQNVKENTPNTSAEHLCNGEILSFGIDKHPSAENVLVALEKAIKITSDCPYRRTFHSDQGWAYQMKAYSRRLKEERIFQSMSRKGNCHDNSVMENFFGLLKQEIYYGVVYYSFEELKSEIERYIKYYNEQRIKEKLGWMSPVQYRLSLLAA